MRRCTLTLLCALSASSASAHCYSIWHYPQPQPCKTLYAPHRSSQTAIALPPVREGALAPDPPSRAFAVPSFEGIDWGSSADPLVERLLRLLAKAHDDM